MEKIGRILNQEGNPMLVRVEGDVLQPVSGNFFGTYWEHGEKIPAEGVRILSPILPSKVIGIGSNYLKHIEEMGREKPKQPKVFLKPNTTVIGNMDPIQIPPGTTRVDHEAELAVVIGTYCSRVSVEEAMDYVLGFTIANDITARDFQKQDGIFTRGKGFDSFCPLGPWILLTKDLSPRKIQCWVNDELRQDSSTADLLFGIPTLISYVSNIMTLLPGDVIVTGTPSGVGPLKDGDKVRIEIEGIGTLINPVINREDRCSLI